MAEAQPEVTSHRVTQAPEPARTAPATQPKLPAHGLAAGHGGAYAAYRELAAASGGQEPPPDQVRPLLLQAEYSHPVNETQRMRVVERLQEQYGNRYLQRVLKQDGPQIAPNGTEDLVQRQATPGAPPTTADRQAGPVADGSGGQALDGDTRSFMESGFGHDFGDVRTHTGPPAQQAAHDLGAQAFTTGRDIYFGQGAYAPTSTPGRGLLAHELAHVVQQDRGLAGPGAQGFRVSQPHDPLERQAEAASAAVLRGELLPPLAAAPRGGLHRQAGHGPAPTPTPAPPAAGGAGTTPAPGDRAAPARAGDFPINVAGSVLVLPLGDLIDKAAPGGKVAVPDRIIKRVPSIPAFKITGASVDLDENKMPGGASVDLALNIAPVEGQGSLTIDKTGKATGSAHAVFRSDKIPGLRQTEADVQISADKFDFALGIDFELPKVTGRLDYKYADHKHSGKGKADYQGAKLHGSLEIIMSEAARISGSGMLEMELFKGLRAQAEVGVDEQRNIKVKGKVAFPGQIELFPEKKYEKSFFNYSQKFPLWGFVIPVIDVNVGLFAEIHAGAGFRAKFGPGVLRDIALTGEFGTDPEQATEFGLGGEFFLPAGAEIVINAGGGIGLGLAVADITGGIEAVGVAGLYTALSVRPQFKYAGGKYTISGMAELAGVAQVKFGINAFAKVDVGVWLFKGTVWRKDWTLAEWIWNTGLNAALRANISYTLGEDFAPDFSFETGTVDPEKFVKDVMPESGSPVPAPAKPPVPEKATLSAEGAQGQATGKAPAAPAPPAPGAAPAKTQAGQAPTKIPSVTAPGTPGVASTGPGTETPEQHEAKVVAGLKALDEQQGSHLQGGRITEEEAEKVAAKVHKDHPIFKTLTVVPGKDTWDFDYTASPGKTKKGAKKALLPSEGDVGTYSELLGPAGDDMTPNHMPQGSLMVTLGVPYRQGVAMNMEQPKGPGGRHRRTRTYGRATPTGADPNDELEEDIKDVRKIYNDDGLLVSKITGALLQVRNLNRKMYPTIFK